MNRRRHSQAGVPRLLSTSLAYWSGEFRPLGSLFYVALYRVFGFHPLTFRIACFLLLTVNLLLVYVVSRSLSGSREIATLATLIFSFHAWFVDLYYSTGALYDILCFLFCFSAFAWYVRIRQAGRQLGVLEWAGILVLYVCALDSREMAVTLPVSLAAYELLYHWPFSGARPLPKELLRAVLPVLAVAAITLPYAIGKLTSGTLAANPVFRPDVSFLRFLYGFNLYTNILLYAHGIMRSVHTALILAIMLELALLARSRTLSFCRCFALFSTLPFIFIPHWSGFLLYMPMVGWALYAATALVTARGALLSRRRWVSVPQARTAVQAATFATLALALAPLHARQLSQSKAVFFSLQLPPRAVAAELARVQPRLPDHARVRFLNDTFPDRGYWLLLLGRLRYHDPGIQVVRRAPAQEPCTRRMGYHPCMGRRQAAPGARRTPASPGLIVMRLTLFNSITLFLMAVTLGMAVARFRFRLEGAWFALYYLLILGFWLGFDGSLNTWWVASGAAAALLLRSGVVHGIFRNGARAAELAFFGYVLWRGLGLLLLW